MNYTQLSKEDILNKISEIEGWFRSDEIEMMYDIVKNLSGSAAIVEIGSWCGRSLSLITLAARKFGNYSKIFSIDPFLTSKSEDNGKFEIFKKNLEKNDILNEITHIKEKSHVAGMNFSEKIELLFIDGFHKYDYVKKDFELFSSNVIENGVIILHDVGSYFGPTKLVQELLETRDLKAIAHIGSSFVFRKSKLSTEDEIVNKNFLKNINNLLETKNLID